MGRHYACLLAALIAGLAGCRSSPNPLAPDPFANPRYHVTPPAASRGYEQRATEQPDALPAPSAAQPRFDARSGQAGQAPTASLATEPLLEFDPIDPAPAAASGNSESLLEFDPLDSAAESARANQPARERVGQAYASRTNRPAPVPSGLIRGRVVDAAGQPQPGAYVIVVQTAGYSGHRAEARTDGNGYFAVQGLRSGARHMVLASVLRGAETLIGRTAAVPPAEAVQVRVRRPRGEGWSGRQSGGPTGKLAGRSAAGVSSLKPNRGPALELPWSDMPSPPPPGTMQLSDRLRPAVAVESDWQPLSGLLRSEPPARLGRPLFGPPAEPHTRAASPGRRSSANGWRQRPGTASLAPSAGQFRPPSYPPLAARRRRLTGDRQLEFALPDLNGRPVRFSSLGSRLVLLDFWATYCGPCLQAMPHLADLQRRYGSRGLQVIGLTYGSGDRAETTARARSLQRELGLNYPLLLARDSGCPLRRRFQVDLYPTLVLVDRTGRVLWRAAGPSQSQMQSLERVIEAHLALSRAGTGPAR